MIVAFMAFFVTAMIASAGVFLMLAGRAVAHVQVKLLDYGFRIRSRLDLDDDWEVVAFWKRDVRDKHVTYFCEGHTGRIGAVAASDFHGLLGDRNGLAILTKSRDLNLAILGHEKLQMGFHFLNDLAPVWTGFGFFMSFLRVFGVVVSFMAFFFGDQGSGSSEGDCQDGGRECCFVCYCFLFHMVVLFSRYFFLICRSD